jgi:hypothetical protein
MRWVAPGFASSDLLPQALQHIVLWSFHLWMALRPGSVVATPCYLTWFLTYRVSGRFLSITHTVLTFASAGEGPSSRCNRDGRGALQPASGHPHLGMEGCSYYGTLGVRPRLHVPLSGY